MHYLLFPFCCQSIGLIFFFVLSFFLQNLKVAVPESISADLGEYFMLCCHFESEISFYYGHCYGLLAHFNHLIILITQFL